MDAHELLSRVSGWLWTLSNRAARRHRLDADDVYQQAAARLLASAHTYKPDRGQPTTWAFRVAQTAVNDLLRQRAKNVPALALTDEVIERHHTVPDAEEVEPVPYTRFLPAALNLLPARERAVLELHHGLRDHAPRPLAEIGRALGVTRQRAHQLHKRATASLLTALLALAHYPAA
jgi:RNA polymerase sigma factor (sigma-70 family)